MPDGKRHPADVRTKILRDLGLLPIKCVAEHVRPTPPDDPSFGELFRRRNDAESINRALEDTMWLRGAHSVGHRRQLLDLRGYALMVNSLAVSRHRQRQQLAA